MSDLEQFDDELLSAYLDDELAPAERALVEARLAADPAVRQLLDELRAVSLAMKDLPRESLPGDLSETVLRRAERAMLTSDAAKTGESASAGGLVELARKLPFGRSRRAWVWAGLTIAAGLMIMVVDKEPGDEADLLGEVARREVVTVRQPMSRLEIRAVEDSSADQSELDAAKPATVRFSETSPSFSDAEEQEELIAKSIPAMKRSGPTTLGGKIEESATTDHFAAGGAGGGFGGAAPGAAPESRSASDRVTALSDDVDLLVVHVNAKPEALERQLIDGVFARNGIVVEEPVAAGIGIEANEPRSGDTARRLSWGAAAAEHRSRRSDAKLNDSAQKVDVVLVEAAPAQIYSCLSEIDADRTNYLGIAVDDEMTAANRSATEKSEFNWKQHDRGFVPAQQKVQVADDNNLYFEANGRQVLLGRNAAEEPQVEQRTAESVNPGPDSQGRTVRMQSLATERSGGVDVDGTWDDDAAPAASPPVAGGELSRNYGESFGFVRRGMDKLAAKANTLQVLFVLSAGEEPAPAATSPSPADSLP